jgi:hypothetical protein
LKDGGRGMAMYQKKLKYVKFDSQRRFGVELEVGNEVKKKAVQSAISSVSKYSAYVSRYALSNNNRYWHIKDDATCGLKGRNGPKGVEIASFIGNGISDIEHISFVSSKLNEIGCKTNHNCGLHVHAEVSDLTMNQVAVIVAHWIKIERLISMILPIRRYQSEHCKFMFAPSCEDNVFGLCRKKKYTCHDFLEAVSPKNLSYFDNDDRRYNLNLVNLVRAVKDNSPNRRTIELRWPEGTLDPLDIRCWVKIFLLFIDNCKDKKMPRNLEHCGLVEGLQMFGLNHPKDTFIIMSESIHETKTWFLERILNYKDDAVEFYKSGDFLKISDEARSILNKMWSPVRIYRCFFEKSN